MVLAFIRWVSLVALPAVVFSASPAGPAETQAPQDPHAVVHGMTISCQTWGGEWGTDDMVRAMTELKALGVNWIAIHPYAGIRADGTVVLWDRAYRESEWLERPIAEAHRLGLKIMIKPHLAYWGSPFSWRGDINFNDQDHWQRFFATYESWLLELARLCRGADAFVVGTELDRTVHHESRWRALIAALRHHTAAPLTYAANWSDYRRVKFWDALDVVGIQAYFSLTDREHLPTETELAEAWSGIIQELTAFAEAQHRKVLLTELGYNRSALAARRPWSHRSGGADAEEMQVRCLRSALQAVDDSRLVVGAFLWKWFAGPTTRENFLKSTPAMRRVIRANWATGES